MFCTAQRASDMHEEDRMGRALCWEAVALRLYRSVLYFANLLLCSAAILPKERRVENQERTVRAEKKLRKEMAKTPSELLFGTGLPGQSWF